MCVLMCVCVGGGGGGEGIWLRKRRNACLNKHHPKTQSSENVRRFTDELSRRKRDESEQAKLWYVIRAHGGQEYVAVPKCPEKT